MSEETKKTGFVPNPNDMVKKATKGNKTAGIIIAIAMVILGVLLFIFPIGSVVFAEWLASIGFIIYGIVQIIVYARTHAESRNGWTLANGIIFALVGIMLVIPSSGGMAAAVIDRMFVFAFLLGFLAMMGGINMCASYGVFKKSGEPGAGWILASGIINLILGIFILIAPFAFSFVLAYIVGIYLIVGGIALFAEAASGNMGRKAA